MDHAHNKYLLLFLFVLSACTSKTPEERLLNLIEEKYANYYINDETHKKNVVAGLREYFKSHKLNDENIDAIKKKLSHINDGHVVLGDDRIENNIHYVSGLKFVIGSNLVEECAECDPSVPKGKYQIVEVDNFPYKKFQTNSYEHVSASTPWGRDFRISRLLQRNSKNQSFIISLKSSNNKIIKTNLRWKKEVITPANCVKGERLEDDIYKINIVSLWCDDSNGGSWSREKILGNFKKQLDYAIRKIKPDDKIILDLRENGGGGDEEVQYVLNSFIDKPVLLYHFKYLRKTHPGGLKWIEEYLPLNLDLWSKEEFQYTDFKYKPKKTFYNNRLVVLTSAGCFSSCETIVSVLKNEKRSKVLGTTTHGGSGDPKFFPIKGTPYSLNLTTCVNWQMPGIYYEGVGVAPDIIMEQTPYSEEDNIIKAAIDLIR